MPAVKKFNTKFNRDLLWNVISFGMIAVIGVLLNVLILNYYDSSALGVFNQVYAIYILFSQLAVGGVHLSVQVFIPRHAENKQHSDVILGSALLMSFISSLAIVALAYLGADLPGIILQSEAVSEGYKYAMWGLLFFSFNKVLLAYYNGQRKMRAFAFFQLLRFILMLGMLSALIYRGISSEYIAAILPLSELVLFLVLFILNIRNLNLDFGWKFKKWLKVHFDFGNKALVGNFLLDVNTKVDIFILGIFLNDKAVGLYSFAATIAEGFMQLPMLFRNNINPVITKAWKRKNHLLLQNIISRNVKAFYKVLSPIAFLSIALFPLALFIFSVKEEPNSIWIVYAILVGAAAITSGYLPFQMVFNQAGFPMQQTQFIFLVFITNVIFNLLLVPLMGIYGSAAGTAISIVAQVLIMKYMLRNKLQIKV